MVDFATSLLLLTSCADLEDDSSQLDEVKELFSEVTLPLKVDKLLKVRAVFAVRGSLFHSDLILLEVSTGWREKVVGASGKGEDDGEGREDSGEGAAEDKKSTSEVCGVVLRGSEDAVGSWCLPPVVAAV